MKKLFSLVCAVLFSAFSTAQLKTEIVSPGVYKITYGTDNDYTLYDPGFQVQTFYLHIFINARDNSTNVAYQDDWFNSNVALNYDPAINGFSGILNLNTKIFTNGNVKLPANTYVARVGLVFKDLQSGATKQSADAAIYIPTTTVANLAATDYTKDSTKSFVANGKLYTKQSGNLQIVVYDMSGKIISKMQAKASENGIPLNVNQHGTYIVKIANGSTTDAVKFIH